MARRESKTTYVDLFRTGLLPVRVLRELPDGQVEVRLTRGRGAYKRGETLTIFRHEVVRKTRVRGGHQYVVSALPDRRNPRPYSSRSEAARALRWSLRMRRKARTDGDRSWAATWDHAARLDRRWAPKRRNPINVGRGNWLRLRAEAGLLRPAKHPNKCYQGSRRGWDRHNEVYVAPNRTACLYCKRLVR